MMPRVDGSTKAAFGRIAAVSGLRRSAFPALAGKSGARPPWRARSAGQSMHYAVPASLWHRPKPSLAWAFGGVKVHRTFTCDRLTHWNFVFVRLTPTRPP